MNVKKGFGKKLLVLDYIIVCVLLIFFLVCLFINGSYSIDIIDALINEGQDISMVTNFSPFNLELFGVILGVWVGQLAISTSAYYVVSKSDHKIQLPIYLINELPSDIKENVDMTQIITTVLSTSDN